MMDRRNFVCAITGGILAGPLSSFAQSQDNRAWRIGILEATSTAMNAANLDAFRQGLTGLGYLEGRNFVIEYRTTDGRNERYAALATELVRLKVDLIVTRGTPATLAAKNATITIPIVMGEVADPVGTGIVASLAHPGGNVTGLSGVANDLDAKRIELLREAVPGLARVGALLNLDNPFEALEWEEIEKAARSLGVQPQLLDVRKREDLGPAFIAAITQRADGLIVAADGLLRSNRQLIADLATRRRLPAIYRSTEFIEAGGLMAYGPDYPDLYRRAATYVDKILRVPSPAICLSSSRPSSSWSLTSRRLRRWD